MSIEKELQKRSGDVCELCSSSEGLSKFTVSPKTGSLASDCAWLCNTCQSQIEDEDTMDPNHWRCLNDSMWNENEPVQVLAYRLLTKLSGEGWPQDLLDMIYMEDDTKEWAEQGLTKGIKHIDSNGVVLKAGDSVVLIKDLKVKGSSMIAKRGTSVRRIRLDPDNATYIEGKVDGQNIVIITDYVKKS